MRYQDPGPDYHERQHDVRRQIAHHIGKLGELPQQLLIGRWQPGAVLVPALCHVSHLVFLLCRKLHR
jgi:hypothetical protein